MSLSGAEGLASAGYVNFLFGALLAAWAMSNGRSGILWLIFDRVLAPVAGPVMLFVHWRALRRKPDSDVSVFPLTGRSDLMSMRKDVI